jgi:hypothetical protein
MEEITANIHLHTTYSDGEGSHAEIGAAALQTGIDVVIVTDHNLLVTGLDGYYQKDGRRALMLVGEEVHDRTRDPQKNHLLVVGAGRELAQYARVPQQLINHARQAGALTFLAHPNDPPMRAMHLEDITWEDWSVEGFTGIELWNGFSEIKSVARSYLGMLFYVLFPRLIARGPLPLTLQRWDALTQNGQRVVAIGGADAHAYHKNIGPLRRRVFPYAFHFQGINNHLLVPKALSGNLAEDRKMVLNAFAQGSSFIGYDLPASTRGFRFTAQGIDSSASMGEEISLQAGITFQIRLPAPAECRLLRNGETIQVWHGREFCTQIINQPGVYRVECYVQYLGARRAWIFSNPIYIR